MKHNLQISVSDKPQRNSMVSSKTSPCENDFCECCSAENRKSQSLFQVILLRNSPLPRLKKEAVMNKITALLDAITEVIKTLAHLQKVCRLFQIS